MNESAGWKAGTGVALLAALGICLGGVGSAQAAYPRPEDPFVNDFADILGPSEEARLAESLRRVRASLGVQATVVTVPSYRSFGEGASSIETFATRLFNDWGVGHWQRDDGVMVVLAVQDREVRIELGDGYGRVHDRRMKRIIDERMVPRFRSGDLAGGLLAAAEALEGALPEMRPVEDVREPAPVPQAAVPSPGSPPPGPQTSSPEIPRELRSRPAPPPVHRAERPWWIPTRLPWAWLAGLVAFLGLGARLYLRYRPRRCPECQGRMRRLSERQDDTFLDAGQRREERVRSTDYDVWRCEVCGEHQVRRYLRWLSGSESCPECSYRTVKTSTRTTRRATYTQTGIKVITRTCAHCSFRDETRKTIPKKVRSSSSSSGSSFSSGGGSSSSFGGGSSSGGGASGKW